jgi:hypothetical protein
MITVQKMSEQLLLSFYVMQNKKGYISKGAIAFIGPSRWRFHSGESEVREVLTSISDESVINLKNAFQYLKDKRLIDFQSNGLFQEHIEIYNLSITAAGVDIIEGVDGAETDKGKYQTTFNVKLADNLNIESLLKAELGSIFKLL